MFHKNDSPCLSQVCRAHSSFQLKIDEIEVVSTPRLGELRHHRRLERGAGIHSFHSVHCDAAMSLNL
jgi:hypothetical protein